jgi:hypothetical protein
MHSFHVIQGVAKRLQQKQPAMVMGQRRAVVMGQRRAVTCFRYGQSSF